MMRFLLSLTFFSFVITAVTSQETNATVGVFVCNAMYSPGNVTVTFKGISVNDYSYKVECHTDVCAAEPVPASEL